MMNNKLHEIIEILKSFPGISKKIAERLAIYMIEEKDISEELNKLIHLINVLKKDYLTGLIIQDGKNANENSEKDTLIVLESNRDVENVLNKTKTNKSLFVLDIQNKRNFKNIQNILDRLFTIINEYNTKEILFLLSPSIETELIIRVVKEELIKKGIKDKLKLTRLSMGIPFGGSIEFSDERTIIEAINKREEI